jgi:type III secretion system FlhB-like substrate exporter
MLVPGMGKQKGDAQKTISNGFGEKADENIGTINSSRGIIFAEDPTSVAKMLKIDINALLPNRFYD